MDDWEAAKARLSETRPRRLGKRSRTRFVQIARALARLTSGASLGYAARSLSIS